MTGADLGLIFIIIGVIMLLAEAVTPGAFLVVPATVLIVLGALGMIAPDLLLSIWSPIIAVLIGVPVFMLTVKAYQKLSPPMPPTTTVATSLIGKEGIVVADICPNNIRGKVKIENDTWSATSVRPIPTGYRVRVVHSEGVHVKVEPIGEVPEAECN
ncbi:MAG: NfeD family protein [Methanomassiliicoccus sp.]|nr:NfeD family protein [Methanomassiliicoccus sp.]